MRFRVIPSIAPSRDGALRPEPLPRDAAPARHILRGRLAAVSVRAAMSAGAWIGFTLGLIVGSLLGALLCWFADAALQWQRDLGLTLGVAQNLLPLGDQIPVLRSINQSWYLVIPGAALVTGLVGAIFAALVAGLVASGYNRASRHPVVLVELPEAEIAAEAVLVAATARPREANDELRVAAAADSLEVRAPGRGTATTTVARQAWASVPSTAWVPTPPPSVAPIPAQHGTVRRLPIAKKRLRVANGGSRQDRARAS